MTDAILYAALAIVGTVAMRCAVPVLCMCAVEIRRNGWGRK